jgi:hypothetical protein
MSPWARHSAPVIAAKGFALWLVLLALAVANGALREFVLAPALGATTALVLSGIVLSLAALATAYAALPWFGRLPTARYVAIGIGWLGLTLLFEFAFGRLGQDKSWTELFDAYTFAGGNPWLVVILVIGAAPFVAAKLRRWA